MTLLFEFFLHHKTSIFDSCIKSFRGICTICHVSIKWSYASTHNSGKIFVNDHNLFSCSYFTSLSDCSSVFLQYNKPERIFGLQMRCRELDIFKIRNFWEIVWKLFGFFGRFFWDFSWIFLGFFWSISFWRIFLGGILCLHC